MAVPNAPFDAAKSIYAGRSVIMLKLLPLIAAVAAEADDDTFTKNGHGLSNGQALLFVSGTGFTGITAGDIVYVRDRADNTFKVATTPTGDAVNITLDGSDGVFQPVSVFESVKLDHKDNRQFKTIDRPDAHGVMRPGRRVTISGAEQFIYQLDEAKRLVTELFSGALSGVREGTATIWEPDPQDATGKVALKSETDFACDITRDGDANFGNGDFTKPMISINSRKAGDVQWTPDAVA